MAGGSLLLFPFREVKGGTSGSTAAEAEGTDWSNGREENKKRSSEEMKDTIGLACCLNVYTNPGNQHRNVHTESNPFIQITLPRSILYYTCYIVLVLYILSTPYIYTYSLCTLFKLIRDNIIILI